MFAPGFSSSSRIPRYFSHAGGSCQSKGGELGNDGSTFPEVVRGRGVKGTREGVVAMMGEGPPLRTV